MGGRDDARVLTLTGAWRAFCSGGDFAWFDVEGPGRELTARLRALAAGTHGPFDRIEALEKPVIAAINGLCVGGGSTWPWRATCGSRPRAPGSASPR